MAPSFSDVFFDRALSYAGVVALLMMLLAASQLLIRFLLSHLKHPQGRDATGRRKAAT